MRTTNISLAALAAALVMTAGCAPRNRELPPGPPSSTTPEGQDAGSQSGTIGESGVPGSRADFLQNVIADRVFFGFDSYSVDDEARRTLDAQAAWLVANPTVRVTIEGHCDERGTREYNLALG